MPRRIARSLTITLTALAGCGHATGGPNPTGAPALSSSPAAVSGPGDSQIVVSADLGSPELIALWSVYGVALADAAEKAGRADYAGEASARALLADRWKELRAQAQLKDQLEKQLHDPYLDQLAEVRDAGFIGEYVLAYLAHPGWTVSGDELGRLNAGAFRAWAATHLPKDHRALTAATVRLRGLSPPPIPGGHLPTTADINPAETPCANLQPAIDRAVTDWDREARALPSVALSIELAEQTLPSLERLSRDPRARRDGVVFVSPAALEILFDAGFCAVDRSDWATAEKMLRRAVELSPANANVRGELVQTLIMQKRPDEADSQLEIALASSDSPCQSAMLWRKRGYILFDRGKLVDSYRAYARSLEFDPQSELARAEMNLIVTTLQRAGTYDDKALAPLIAPNGKMNGKMHVTSCPR